MKKLKDTDLREALRRNYAETPQLPEGFMERMHEAQETTPMRKSRRLVWLHVAFGAAAASILLLLMFNNKVEPEEVLPMVAQQVQQEKDLSATTEVNMPETAETDKSVEPHPVSDETPHAGTIKTEHRCRRVKTRQEDIPDTQDNVAWQDEKNVILALQMLADCEATIKESERNARNGIIDATFHATPQSPSAILASDEAGDYIIIEPRTIVDI